jgi:hypothetical protein
MPVRRSVRGRVPAGASAGTGLPPPYGDGRACGGPTGHAGDRPTRLPYIENLTGKAWLTSRWEDVDPRAEKRPARRYCRPTADGAVQAGAGLAGARRPKGTALRRLAQGDGVA